MSFLFPTDTDLCSEFSSRLSRLLSVHVRSLGRHGEWGRHVANASWLDDHCADVRKPGVRPEILVAISESCDARRAPKEPKLRDELAESPAAPAVSLWSTARNRQDDFAPDLWSGQQKAFCLSSLVLEAPYTAYTNRDKPAHQRRISEGGKVPPALGVRPLRSVSTHASLWTTQASISPDCLCITRSGKFYLYGTKSGQWLLLQSTLRAPGNFRRHLQV